MAVSPRLRGTIHLPADKSIAHRALLFNAMGHGNATITLRAPGEDVLSTAAALAALGLATVVAGSDTTAPTRVLIQGGGTSTRAGLPGTNEVTIDCGNAGTLMRLLIGAATTRPGRTILTGDASLNSRPMERVARPLRAMGAQIETTNNTPPVTITGGVPLQAGTHVLEVASAQVLGAIILAALQSEGTTEIQLPGPARDHTERMLAWLGVDIERVGSTIRLTGPAAWAARDIDVPADPSGAAFWLVAGAVHPNAEITLPNVGLNPTRLGVIRVLERMGAEISVSATSASDGPEPAGDITVRSADRLRAVELEAEDVADVIDELPILAVAMAAAEGTSRVRGAGELRVKESDRITLVVEGLRAMGVAATETADGWDIVGGPLRRPAASEPATTTLIRTAGDHRIAMAFAIADSVGLGAKGAAVDNPECAAISYPGFWSDLAAITGESASDVPQ